MRITADSAAEAGVAPSARRAAARARRAAVIARAPMPLPPGTCLGVVFRPLCLRPVRGGGEVGRRRAAVNRQVNDDALDILFRQARSHGKWLDKPVTDEQLHAIYDLMKMA